MTLNRMTLNTMTLNRIKRTRMTPNRMSLNRGTLQNDPLEWHQQNDTNRMTFSGVHTQLIINWKNCCHSERHSAKCHSAVYLSDECHGAYREFIGTFSINFSEFHFCGMSYKTFYSQSFTLCHTKLVYLSRLGHNVIKNFTFVFYECL